MEVWIMTHRHGNTKAMVDRLSRAIGHLQAIRTMVEEERDCSEVLMQIAAVKSAINNIGREILKEHITHCVVDAARDNDMQVIQELNAALDRYMK